MHKSILTVAAALALAVMGLGRAAPAHAVTEIVRSTLSVSVDGFVFFNPCVLDGRGEEVELSGTFEAEITTTMEDGEATHLTVNVDPREASGRGQTSGAAYRGRPGATAEAEPIPGSPGHWKLQPLTLSPGGVAYQPANGGWYESGFEKLADAPQAPENSPAYLDLDLETDTEGRATRLLLYRIVLDCRP